MENVITQPSIRERVRDYVSLTKPGITSSVVLTTAVGYWLGLGGNLDPYLLAQLLLATGAASGGAATLNMVVEHEGDARMQRTKKRPIPDGRIQPMHAGLFGLILSIGGVGWLALAVGPLPALITAAIVLGYVFAYTPLKPITSFSTWVGIPVGAAPPIIGWAAATGRLDAGAGALFLLLALWQVPHILAMAWMNRDDFIEVEYPLAPIFEGSGKKAARQLIGSLVVLTAACFLPYALGLVDLIYLVPVTIGNLWWLTGGIRFARDRSRIRARYAFFQSLLWLPWVMLFLTLGKI